MAMYNTYSPYGKPYNHLLKAHSKGTGALYLQYLYIYIYLYSVPSLQN